VKCTLHARNTTEQAAEYYLDSWDLAGDDQLTQKARKKIK